MATGWWPASTTSFPGKARRGQNELGKWSLYGSSGVDRPPGDRGRSGRGPGRTGGSTGPGASPPGVPKARQGSPSRRASDGLRVVRGRVPGRSELASPSSSQSIWARVPRQKPRPGTTGELCSQPPLGVAATRLPCRSTTSTWQEVSPKVGSRTRQGPRRPPGRRRPRAGGGCARRATPVAGPATPRPRPGPGAPLGVVGVEQAVKGYSRRQDRRTRPPGRRRRAWRARPPCGRRRRCPGPSPPGRTRRAARGCWSSTGPWPHGPVLRTVQPRCSADTGSSTVARQPARSSPPSSPLWRRPLTSMTSAVAR